MTKLPKGRDRNPLIRVPKTINAFPLTQAFCKSFSNSLEHLKHALKEGKPKGMDRNKGHLRGWKAGGVRPQFPFWFPISFKMPFETRGGSQTRP